MRGFIFLLRPDHAQIPLDLTARHIRANEVLYCCILQLLVVKGLEEVGGRDRRQHPNVEVLADRAMEATRIERLSEGHNLESHIGFEPQNTLAALGLCVCDVMIELSLS